MYKYIILFLKGIIIGIGKVLPGVSGSMIALNMGLYEQLINSISNYFKNIYKNTLFLMPICLGILLSIIFGSKLIDYLLIKNYIITMFFFIGLIIGSLKEISNKVKIKEKKQFLIFIITFILMIFIYIFKNTNIYYYQDNLLNNLYVLLIGFIDASTMIIPGISGTAIFILMGCYNFFLNIFSSLNLNNLKIYIMFCIGLFIGMILITKLMNHLLNKKKDIIYPIIYSFSLSSILFLLLDTIVKINNLFNLIVGLIILFITLKITKRINF